MIPSTHQRTLATIAVLIASLLLAATPAFAGKGVGAGGGSSLQQTFDRSRAAIEFLSGQWTDRELARFASCPSNVRQWILSHQRTLKQQFKVMTFQWLPDSQSAPASQWCGTPVGDSVVYLVESQCKPQIIGRRDALAEITEIAVAMASSRQRVVRRGAVATCLAEAADDNFWRYAWSDENLRQMNKELITRSTRLVGNPTERLRRYLDKARRYSAAALERLHLLNLPPSTDQSITTWLNSMIGSQPLRMLLADDVRRAPHIIQNHGNRSCAYTYFEARAPVYFTLSLCQHNIETIDHAVQTLVHESTHHAPFGIRDEITADAIGKYIADVIAFNPLIKVLGEEEGKKTLREVGQILDDILRR